MCGIMTDYDTVQNKIKNGYIFKVKKKKKNAKLLTSVRRLRAWNLPSWFLADDCPAGDGWRSNCLITSRQTSDHSRVRARVEPHVAWSLLAC